MQRCSCSRLQLIRDQLIKVSLALCFPFGLSFTDQVLSLTGAQSVPTHLCMSVCVCVPVQRLRICVCPLVTHPSRLSCEKEQKCRLSSGLLALFSLLSSLQTRTCYSPCISQCDTHTYTHCTDESLSLKLAYPLIMVCFN